MRSSVRQKTPSFDSFLRHFLLALVLFFPASGLSADTDIRFDRYSVEEGLPNATVNVIIQDKTGFMWFGTLDGLCRFDGYECTTYRNDPADSMSLSGNQIWSLLQDRSGIIWVGTVGAGLNRMDPATGKFVRFRPDLFNASAHGAGTIKALLEDRDGRLWIGTFGGGLAVLDQGSGEIRWSHTIPGDSTSLSHDVVKALYEDDDGELWIGTEQGMNKFDRRSGRFVRYHFPIDNIYSIAGSRNSHADKTLWIAARTGGVYRLDLPKGDISVYQSQPSDSSTLSSNEAVALASDRDGTLWVGTYGSGLNSLNPSSHLCRRIRSNWDDTHALADAGIRCVYVDSRGGVWVGTTSAGVNRINTERKSFHVVSSAGDNPLQLTTGSVNRIFEDRTSTLWIGTTLGLSRLNRQKRAFHQYTHDPGNPHSLPHNHVVSVLEDQKGRLWIGMFGGGISRLDRESGRFEQYRHKKDDSTSISTDDVMVIHEGHAGILWVGTAGGGLNRFDPTQGTFTHYKYNQELPQSLSNDRVTAIVEDARGVLWIGTEGGGLNALDPTDGTFRHYGTSGDGSKSLSSDIVLSLLVSGENDLWIGTVAGLDRLSIGNGRVTRASGPLGAPLGHVRGIIDDVHGKIWLCTTKGLTRYDPHSGAVSTYVGADGLLATECTGERFRSNTGELYIGGPFGYTYFNPDSIHDSHSPPPVVVTAFNIFEKPAHLDSLITDISNVSLSYSQNYLSFWFAALDFSSPSRNRYAYRMEGVDTGWVSSGTRRYAAYTSLPPGDYVFRVRGANADGTWNMNGARMAIVINPPVWARWWFRTTAVVLAVAILFLAYRYRVSQIIKVERMRLRIAGDLHDDIGSSLGSIALVSDMIRNRPTLEEREKSQLMEISLTARQTADALRDMVWVINPEHDRVDNLVLRMKDAAASLLRNIPYSFECTSRHLETVLDMEFRRHLLLMYKEVLHNILKHANAHRVEITISEEGGAFRLSVTDDGDGFDPSRNGGGHGLKSLKNRAAKLDGSVLLRSAPGRGTTVEIRARIP